MLSSKDIRSCPKDGHPREENLGSQPINHQPVFNRSDLLTEGWYPVCPSSEIRRGKARSFSILNQRFVVFRGQNRKLAALDSFCPYMGADLGNGTVVDNNIQCFFHHWRFTPQGEFVRSNKTSKSDNCDTVDLNHYPVEEKYNFIWIYSAPITKNSAANHSVPNPPDIEGPVQSMHFKRVELFAHHHVMMTNGIDLQHFKSVHSLDIDFDYDVTDKENGIFQWTLAGKIPKSTLLLRLARLLIGDTFRYKVLFAGGSITSISYGVDLRFRGTGFKIPSINILWGGTPTLKGISSVEIFFVVKKYSGWLAPAKRILAYLMSVSVLSFLRDDDIKAFPHIRFNVGKLTSEDHSISRFIKLTNQLKISPWTQEQ